MFSNYVETSNCNSGKEEPGVLAHNGMLLPGQTGCTVIPKGTKDHLRLNRKLTEDAKQ